MVMHYHFGVSPVNYSDYDSLHKVYLEYINMFKMNFTVQLQNRAVIDKLKAARSVFKITMQKKKKKTGKFRSFRNFEHLSNFCVSRVVSIFVELKRPLNTAFPRRDNTSNQPVLFSESNLIRIPEFRAKE